MTIAHRRETVQRHPLYEIQERAQALEHEILQSKATREDLISHLLTMNMLVRGLIAVGLAEVEGK